MNNDGKFICVDGTSSQGVCVLKLLATNKVRMHRCNREHLDCLWKSVEIDNDVLRVNEKHQSPDETLNMRTYVMDIYQSFSHSEQKYISVIEVSQHGDDIETQMVHFTRDPSKNLNEFQDWMIAAPAGYLCCYEGAEVGKMLSCPLHSLLWSESSLLFFDVRHFIDLFSLGGRSQSGGFHHNLTRLDHYPDTEALAVDFTRESSFFYDKNLSSLLSVQLLENARVVFDIITSKNLFSLQREVSLLSGIGWAEFQCVSGLQKYVESLVKLHADEYHRQKSECKKRKPPSSYRGGLIVPSTKGLHCSEDKKIVMLDFQSLYPSIFVSNFPDHGLHALMKHCLSEKVRLKREGRIVEATALKLSANSMYGNLGNSHSVVYESETAGKICTKGREALTHVIEEAHSRNYTTPFGHTDSIFAVMPKEDSGEEFCNALNETTNNGLILEHEGDAEKIFIISNSTYCYVPLNAPLPVEYDELPPLHRKNFVYKNAMGLFSKGSPPMFEFIADRVFFVWMFYDVPLTNSKNDEGVLDLTWKQLQKCLLVLVEKLDMMWEFLKENKAYYDVRCWTCYKKIDYPQVKRGNFMERREKNYELVFPSECEEGMLWDPMEEYVPALYEMFAKACTLICSTASSRDIVRILRHTNEILKQ